MKSIKGLTIELVDAARNVTNSFASHARRQRIIEIGSGCVAQLVEQWLPIPEVRGLNPVIGKN